MTTTHAQAQCTVYWMCDDGEGGFSVTDGRVCGCVTDGRDGVWMCDRWEGGSVDV